MDADQILNEASSPHAAAWFDLGEAALAQSELEQAVEAFEQTIRLKPDHALAYFNLGLTHYKRKDFEAAERAYRRYLEMAPDSVQGRFNLGAVLQDAHRLEEAMIEYRRALAFDPDLVDAHRGLGNIALHERRYEDAVGHFRAGLSHAPQDVELLSNLGVMLQKLNRLDEAEAALRQAIKHAPDYVNAHFNLALVLLLQGRFEEGWEEYEWRHRIKSLQPVAFSQPEWDGSPLGGKTILLRQEQGFGDTFQFVRYAASIQATGGRVTLECQPGIKRVLMRTPGIDVIAGRPTQGHPLVNFDTHVPLLSLPRLFHAGHENLSQTPYIHAEPWLAQRWLARLARDRKLRVGIVWAGRPTHEDDKNRSCPLAHFLALAAVPDVTLYSLQKGDAAQALGAQTNAAPVIDLDVEIDDFADTAAAIANLDLVVCVDTSVAHLAGAMGKPVWVVLPYAPDWRWMAAGETCLWYPSMRLFRQTRSGDWDGVFASVMRALEALSQNRARIAEAKEPDLSRAYDEATVAALREARRALRQGDWQAMAAACKRVLAQDPGHVEASWLSGVAELSQGRFEQALGPLVRVYESWPQHPMLLKNLGTALQSLKQFEQAEQCYGAALQYGNDDPEVLYNLGGLRQLAGDLEGAANYYRAALAVEPGFPECLNNLGLALRGLGQTQQAIERFREAIEVAPQFFDSWLNLGNELYLEGDSEAALACFRRALELRPDHAGAHNALAVLLKSGGEIEAAMAEFEQALKIDPAHAEARSNLGNALKQLGRVSEAIDQYRLALDLAPGNARTWSNLGSALQLNGEAEQAIEAFDRALALAPNLPEAHWNRALALLLKGEYAQGWAEYEWGFAAGARPLGVRDIPRWKGENLSGGTLLASAEQGYGDAIQFVRFLRQVGTRAGKVILECRPELHALLASCDGVDGIVGPDVPDAALPPIAARIPLMSLSYLFGTTLSDLPGSYPYLTAEPERVARLKPAISDGIFKVGIVWAGASAHQDDRYRSCDPKLMCRLAEVPGVRLYSLQMDRDFLPPQGGACAAIDLAPLLGDFADTAAAIACLDLVISVDTAVAHLAGAMGRPVWILLAVAPDWRWGRVGNTTPWYPSARLFRQVSQGDWSGVITEAISALQGISPVAKAV